ncbi:TPA: hypothetical protein N0F65_009354 [Lagenidium giganteum]|uniref:Metallo-beta-lactamase domain-containing protein n=1 Tax=Lagenidium giganteum TaxID=4803 RepID=A0AAV2ZF13_9STRA|nr:TPA: hypothetical protein N0F65_009354 [Lagenidium giganteum]
MEVVVLGCGPSSSVPSIRCLLTRSCHICTEAHENPHSKNRRLNPSILVKLVDANKSILIDCGKTFRESVLRVFPQINVDAVDAIVLTHGHADACLGLDDLREVQPYEERFDPVTNESLKVPPAALVVHCCPNTKKDVEEKFAYLIEKPAPPAPSGAPVAFRWIAQLRLQVFEAFASFGVCNDRIKFTPLPVIHGADYTSFGFEFGAEFGARFVYISDVSEVTDVTRAYLTDASRPAIDVLLIDALYVEKYHSTHMNLQAVLQEIRIIRPKRTVLTGMSHDFDYYKTNVELQQYEAQEGLVVEMAFDGMRMAFPSADTTA